MQRREVSATGAASLRRLSAIAALAYWPLAADAADEEEVRIPPFPAQDDCPNCLYGMMRCPRTCRADMLRGFYFDFAYHSGTCWEEIPAGDGSVMLDLDVWCIEPLARNFMNCSNMFDFVFQGVSMLGSCIGAQNDSALVKESCFWECKNNRPAARCKWEFDHQNAFDTQNRIDACWLEETCAPRYNNEVEVSIACQPHAGVVSKARHELTQDRLDSMKKVVQESAVRAGSMRHQMQANRNSFQDELNAWKELLEREQSQHQKTKEELEEAREGLADANEERETLTLGIVGIAALCILVIIVTSVCGVFAYRRWKRMYSNGADSEAGTVVVGRPVDAEQGGGDDAATGHAIGNAYGAAPQPKAKSADDADAAKPTAQNPDSHAFGAMATATAAGAPATVVHADCRDATT
eukprot:TRINITY_DN100487_c0_g1_i1.p1 TRINITY_DN100487_c0_g1~~TRINITY_DN100487_c0_g1_i1.p1  ORF type:complete len:409 (-),score=83.92 TRINITY_DN100487_c0_g1_i1:208-1434(-)